MLSKWRNALATVVLLGVLGVLHGNDATVIYKDRTGKKTTSVAGTIEEENFLGIKLRISKNKEVEVIPTAAIQMVIYKLKDVDSLSYRSPFNKEVRAQTASEKVRAVLLQEAQEELSKMEKEIKSPPEARRYIQFKLAEVTVQQARLNPARMENAIKALTDFKATYKQGWQLPLGVETLAGLLEESGKPDEARKALEELTELPGVPDAVRGRGGMLIGKLHLRAGQFREAETRLSKVVAGMSGADTQKPLVILSLVESQVFQDKFTTAQKELDAVIAGTSDSRIRGLAYVVLGEYYLRKGQSEDAFWSFLRVDAQYNEDLEAQGRALTRLAQLFDRVKKDPIRGKDCLQRLLDKRFEGTTYQKQARVAIQKMKDTEKE